MVKENLSKKLAFYIQRTEQIKKIENARQENLPIYTLKGDGGVGKTILLQLYRKHLLENDFPESRILSYDFDDYRYRTPCDLRMAISEDLGSGKNFKDYYAERNILRKSSSNKDITPEELERIKERVSKQWENTLETLAEESPIIIMLDTLDALTPDDREDLLKCFFNKPLNNVFILLAGRVDEINDFKKELKKKWKYITNNEKFIDSIQIEPLSREDSREYFIHHYTYNGAPLSENIEKNLEEKVYQLTEGIPLIVDLFATVSLSDDTIWDELKEKTISEETIDSDRTWFKRQLINRLSRSNKTNELAPLLAHIWPLNYHMLAELKDINEGEAIDLMWTARKSAYIKILPDPISPLLNNEETIKALKEKGKIIPDFMITLHDIMRELIIEFGFDSIDSKKKDRLDYSNKFIPLSKKLIEQIEKKLKTLKKEKYSDDKILRYSLLKHSLQTRELKNTLFINPKNGIELFSKLFENHFGKGKHEQGHFIKQLFNLIAYYDNKESKKNTSKTNYFAQLDEKEDQSLIVDYLLKEIEFWGARNLTRAETALLDLEKLKLGKSLYIHAYDEIVEYRIRSGKFKEALELANDGIKFCEESASTNNKTLYKQWFKLLTLKGWALRLIGNIPQADEVYTDALELPAKYELMLGIDIPSIDMAHLLNTMSYVKAFLRDYDQAIALYREAKDLFIKVNYTRGIGMTESTRGRIEIEFDHYQKANKHLKNALNYFSLDDHEWRGKIYLGLAHAYWLQGQFGSQFDNDGNSDDSLKKSKDALIKAEEHIIPADKAELFHLKANLALLDKHYDEALENYKQCEKVAEEMHALYYQARAMGGEMRIASLRQEIENAHIIREKFDKFLLENPEEKHDQLTIALFNRHDGDIFLIENKLEKAIDSYKKALPKLGKHGRYTPFNLTGQMKDLTDFFIRYINTENKKVTETNRKKENIRKIGKELLHFWMAEPCESNKQMKPCKSYSRTYSAAYQILTKWTSGDPDKWDHKED